MIRLFNNCTSICFPPMFNVLPSVSEESSDDLYPVP